MTLRTCVFTECRNVLFYLLGLHLIISKLPIKVHDQGFSWQSAQGILNSGGLPYKNVDRGACRNVSKNTQKSTRIRLIGVAQMSFTPKRYQFDLEQDMN